MRRGEVFWGAILILLGGLFLLKAAGYLVGDVFAWFWPLLIVAAGAWLILAGFRAREPRRFESAGLDPAAHGEDASVESGAASVKPE